ncbi:MAG: exodeoxyribonuclease VII large subunit, partial [Flammeovirgaceae bacterium]
MEEVIATHNSPAISVSELSSALKRTIETAFEHVRVRGEISTCKIASSGHIYFDLKDDKSLINAVCWKGVAAKLLAIPENGMEVICTGRISTYAGRSNYQLVVEYIELSGAGALAAMLEKRKQQLASEGLFDAGRKRQLPYLPKTIGVVTSPTGAVIRDILHRISERFPLRVLVWGVLVQGRGAEAQI